MLFFQNVDKGGLCVVKLNLHLLYTRRDGCYGQFLHQMQFASLSRFCEIKVLLGVQ